MSLPTLSKSWQFNVNQVCGAGAVLSSAQDCLYKIKASLRGFGTNAWGCWGSNDGQGAGHFGNGDANDRWASSANLIWATAGSNHSWIVLSQAGLGGNAAICFDCNSNSGYNLTVALSPAMGFGTANGGADGIATARPTAADEVVLINSTSWGAAYSAWTGRVHAMQSTDGQCTRIAIFNSNSPYGVMMFDKAKNPVSVWTVPVFGLALGSLSVGDPGVMTVANCINSALMRAVLSGTIGLNASMTTGMRAGSTIAEALTFADEDSGDWVMSGLGIYVTTVGHRGARGEVFDCWQGSPTRQSGDQYPAAGTRLFVQIGDFVWPWNGSVFIGT